MKFKLIFIMCCAIGMLAATNANAQAASNTKQYTTLTGSTDSVVATGTKYLTASLDGVILGGSIEVLLTKSAGNARATLILQGGNSLTGTFYDLTNGVSHTVGDKTVVDTITNTAGVQSKPFLLSEAICKGFKFVRIKVVGAGTTGHTQLAGSSIYRRYEP